ncbi:MAG TPA: hypothetical protein DIT04_13920 [Dysgonomonas sp.]|nr:hypothetical protein [Dysgonomonas sp.]
MREDREKPNKIELSEWLDESNRKLQDFLNNIEISDEISEYAEKSKWDILANVNRRIDNNIKKIRLFKLTAAAAACIALLTISTIFYRPGEVKVSETERLMSVMETLTDDVEEVCIIAGNTQKIVENKELITQTEEGKLLVGKDEQLSTDDLETQYITIVVPNGRRSSVLFSDGSKVHLNAGTKLVYPKIFSKESRNILVDGEIFIDVASDNNRPFIVHTKDMDIQVLGTQFNVRAYNKDNESSVVLAKGSVQVTTGSQTNKLIPGQGIFNINGSTDIKDVDVYSYICWKDGRIQLMDEPFDALLKKLSRYYGIEIISDPQLNNYRFEGKLNLYESLSLEEILKTLMISKPFSFTKEECKIYVHP